MKTLKNLNAPVLGLDRQPLVEPGGSPLAVKNLLANALARGQSDEPARAMSIALRIYEADGTTELEDADYELLRSTLQKDPFLNNMAKVAALTALGEPEADAEDEA